MPKAIKYTRSLFAAFLLLVFSIGNTPKTAFHFLFADHQDTHAEHGTHFQVKGKTCDIQDLVCSMPFEAGSFEVSINTDDYRNLLFIIPGNKIIFEPARVHQLRGPPAYPCA